MRYNGDYFCALFAVDSLCIRCPKLGMRQALSFAAIFLTESLSTFIVNSLSHYTFFQTPFLLGGVELQRPLPFWLLPISSTSTNLSIYAVNPLPDNHGGQTAHLHQPLGTDSHAKSYRQQPLKTTIRSMST